MQEEIFVEKLQLLLQQKRGLLRKFNGMAKITDFLCGTPYSRVVDPEKKAYFVKNKNASVIWILNDQNPSKWSLEGC